MSFKERSLAFFQNSDADSLLLRNFHGFKDQNLQYISGLEKAEAFYCQRKNKPAVLLASTLEAANLEKKGFKVLEFSNEKQLIALLKKSLGRKIALNFAAYPVRNFESLKKLMKGRKFIDAFETFASLRSKKLPEEVEKIKEACRISEMAADYFENFFRQGMSEIEVSERIKDFFTKRMNCSISFEPIVAFRENSSIPHHECSRRRIEGNGVLLLDFGAKFQGYCSDISRTYFIEKPSEEISQTYHFVFEAKKLAESLLVPGESAGKIASEIDSFLKQKLKKGMIHALGHGIGLQEHDFPEGISPKAKFKIEESQCLAIEPAFYCSEFGIRLEDNCVIGKQGAKMLSAAPKELIAL